MGRLVPGMASPDWLQSYQQQLSLDVKFPSPFHFRLCIFLEGRSGMRTNPPISPLALGVRAQMGGVICTFGGTWIHRTNTMW